MTVRILRGDVRDRLRELPDESVHCVVTSPPYYGLRDYGMAGQIGLEERPEDFVDQLVAVFREVRRPLRADGTAWVNMGDSYSANRGYQVPHGEIRGSAGPREAGAAGGRGMDANVIGLAPKQLMGIPWRVAFALQADGWWLRQDIIWHKPNPMPESVRDRCTKAHEYIFMLSKSERYFYDQEAIKVPASLATGPRTQRAQESEARADGVPGQAPHSLHNPRKHGSTLTGGAYGRHALGDAIPEKERRDDKQRGHGRRHAGFNDRWDAMEKEEQCSGMVNKRSVWTVATQPYSEAHFATFPPALIEPCILAGCPPGGVVLDPFGGAGTTGLVADRLQRDAILIELNPAYADMAERRIRAESPMFSDVRSA